MVNKKVISILLYLLLLFFGFVAGWNLRPYLKESSLLQDLSKIMQRPKKNNIIIEKVQVDTKEHTIDSGL